MRIFVCLVLLTLMHVSVQAQRHMGFKAGLNMASQPGLIYIEHMQPGLHVGLYQENYLNKSWFIRSELLYSQKGLRYKTFVPQFGNIDLRFRLNYLDAVVALHWKTLSWLDIYSGAQLGVLISHRVWISPSQIQAEYEDPSRLEFAPLIGSRINLNTHIGINLRFTYGTWSIDGYPAAKSAVGMMSLEYTL